MVAPLALLLLAGSQRGVHTGNRRHLLLQALHTYVSEYSQFVGGAYQPRRCIVSTART